MKRIKCFVRLFLIASLCLFSSGLHSQQTPQKFIQETQYLLSLPDGYKQDTAKRWPLLIFLHGSGESGNDLEKVKLHGPPELVEKGKKFPFIIVSPQAPLGIGWDPGTLYQLIRYIKQTQRVDDLKVYLTGLSMGGFGTWDLAMKHPEEFAAILPVCGGGDTTDAWKLRHIAVWNFHGAKDDVVAPAQSDNMVKAVRSYNPSAKYTLYPNANHNSWDLTYNNDSLYQWMLAQSKFLYKEVPADPAIFKQFTGKYTGRYKDTVVVVIENQNLVAKTNDEVIPLKYAGGNKFFIGPALPMDITFNVSKGVAQSFLFMGNERVLFKRSK